MSINIFPVKVEAYDSDTNDLLFTMQTFDEHCANIEIKTVISPGNVKELTDAIQKAVTMLELK